MSNEEKNSVLQIVLAGTRSGDITWKAGAVADHYLARLVTGEDAWDLHLGAPTETTQYLMVDSAATGETEEMIVSSEVGPAGAAMLQQLLQLVRGPLEAQRADQESLLDKLRKLPWTTPVRQAAR